MTISTATKNLSDSIYKEYRMTDDERQVWGGPKRRVLFFVAIAGLFVISATVGVHAFL